ncbi:MAG: hypothetical protein V4738_05420 [Pseudomonadota bacterium]
MRTFTTAFKVPAAVAAAVLAPMAWAAGDSLAERTRLDNLELYQLGRPVALGGWPAGWVQPDLAPNGREPRLRLGSVRVKPSLFSSNSGSISGAGLWLGKGETWRLAVGTRRQPVRNGLGFAPDSGETSLVTASYLWSSQQSLSLQWVRQGSTELGQRTVHLVYGTALAGNQSLKFGISAISGWEPVGGSQQRMGLSVGYDWPSYFVKVAYDPQVNFTAKDQVRVSLGTRF